MESFVELMKSPFGWMILVMLIFVFAWITLYFIKRFFFSSELLEIKKKEEDIATRDSQIVKINKRVDELEKSLLNSYRRTDDLFKSVFGEDGNNSPTRNVKDIIKRARERQSNRDRDKSNS